MATSNVIAHKNLTDPQLHEPKGVYAANEGTVYVANGAGSGAWQALPFSDLNYSAQSVTAFTYNLIDIDTSTDNPDYVPDVDFSVLTPMANETVSDASSFEGCNKNVKEVGLEVSQLRADFKKAVANMDSLKGAFDELRTNLIASGIITAPTP